MVEQVRRLRRDSQSRSGRPRVAVLPYYEGTPSVADAAGRTQAESCGILVRSNSHGPGDRNRRCGAPPGVCVFGIRRNDAA
jgi:hypothetical protein